MKIFTENGLTALIDCVMGMRSVLCTGEYFEKDIRGHIFDIDNDNKQLASQNGDPFFDVVLVDWLTDRTKYRHKEVHFY